MKDDYTVNSHYLTHTFLGEYTLILSSGVKGLTLFPCAESEIPGEPAATQVRGRWRVGGRTAPDPGRLFRQRRRGRVWAENGQHRRPDEKANGALQKRQRSVRTLALQHGNNPAETGNNPQQLQVNPLGGFEGNSQRDNRQSGTELNRDNLAGSRKDTWRYWKSSWSASPRGWRKEKQRKRKAMEAASTRKSIKSWMITRW